MIPNVLKSFDLYIDGRGHAGLAEEVTLPKLTMQSEEWQAGGMAGPIKLDLGIEALTLEFTLGGYNEGVLSMWGVSDPSGINARFLGAAVAGDGTGTQAIEVSVRGRWEELDMGSAKKKELSRTKVKMPLTYYRLTINSRVIHDIDLIGGKTVINGVDLSAELLRALGMPV